MFMGHLQGKVAVITGAGRGIGRAHALSMAAQGARLVINDVGCERDGSGQGSAAKDVVEEILATGGNAVVSSDEVGSSSAAQSIMQTALREFGQLDILVNNAGILRDRTLLKMTDEEWDDVVRVHLKGTFCCLRAAAQIMKDQGRGGRIINTSSSSGLLGNFGQANYGAAKAGIHTLTRIAAAELGRYGITVNAIAPLAWTRMTDDLPKGTALSQQQAMSPEFISPIVAFLASDAAKEINGETFGVEGNHVFCYRMMTSHGITRNSGDGPWSFEELRDLVPQAVTW
ncbi:MAG: short-chain dehydrogenase [Planctomycetaceae bacterium]|nr:short-chain dehydrogenase [Planctomycetaceae bacterium]